MLICGIISLNSNLKPVFLETKSSVKDDFVFLSTLRNLKMDNPPKLYAKEGFIINMSTSVKSMDNFSVSNPLIAREIESWVVNSVKVKMIAKMDSLLEVEGKVNVRKLFLVPVTNILELSKRVQEMAPELKTFFYKELSTTIGEAEKRLV